MRHFDVIVVGLGGIGSAAAAHLAARGSSVLGLDRFPIAHDRGSSHGQTRLIRLAYFEHPDYVPLLRRAFALWRELEAQSGRRLLVESGLVTTGPADADAITGTLRSAAAHGLSVDRLTATDAHDRWPQFAIPADWTVLHEREAGYLLVEECVAAHAAWAVEAGATLELGPVVRSWHTDGAGVVVSTDREAFTADRLVLAPGPWAAGLLQLPGVRLEVLRKSLFWYRPAAPAAPLFAEGACPCFAFDAPTGFFYGFPSIDSRGVKIAEHSGGRPVLDPLDVERGVDAAERRLIEGIAATHLPTLGHALADHAVCLYTMSPDHHFLVGVHPDHDRVAIAAGFSGHGFKFASVMGEALADLALTANTPLPLGFLSPTRFC